MKLFVEGGGDDNALKTECRRGFKSFIEKACPGMPQPRIVASGSRSAAFDDFCTALRYGENALLLVDSEDGVHDLYQQGDFHTWRPWEHLHRRDGWVMPNGSNNIDCHIMVQSMESWFLADSSALQEFFGSGFNINPLPRDTNRIEAIQKAQVMRSISTAVMHCTTRGKSEYSKGEHSFKILAIIDPQKVMRASPWAERFINAVRLKMEE